MLNYMFIINYTIFSLIIILLIENIDKLTKYFNIGGVTVEGLPDADADADAEAEVEVEVVDPVEVDGEKCPVQGVGWVVFVLVVVAVAVVGGFGGWMWGRRSTGAEASATKLEPAQVTDN